MANITGLSAATKYSIAVRAFTKVGSGPIGNFVTATTNESGEFFVVQFF